VKDVAVVPLAGQKPIEIVVEIGQYVMARSSQGPIPSYEREIVRRVGAQRCSDLSEPNTLFETHPFLRKQTCRNEVDHLTDVARVIEL